MELSNGDSCQSLFQGSRGGRGERGETATQTQHDTNTVKHKTILSPRLFCMAKLHERCCSHDLEEHEKFETQSGRNRPVEAPGQLEGWASKNMRIPYDFLGNVAPWSNQKDLYIGPR